MFRTRVLGGALDLSAGVWGRVCGQRPKIQMRSVGDLFLTGAVERLGRNPSLPPGCKHPCVSF